MQILINVIIKGGLDFSNPPVYNELKKGIQMQNLMPSVKFYILCISHSIKTFLGRGCYSYYVDLYKSKDRKKLPNSKVNTSIVFMGITSFGY